MESRGDDPALDLLEEEIRFLCRRYRLSPEDADDLAQNVRLTFTQKRKLASYDGRGSLRSFVRVAVQNIYLDMKRHQSGRPRASQAATKLGPVAVRLEELLYRESCSLIEAWEKLRSEFQPSPELEEVRILSIQLNARLAPRETGPDTLETFPDSRDTPEAAVLRQERREQREELLRILEEEKQELSPEEQLLLKLRFEDGLKVPQFAHRLGVANPHSLYERFSVLLRSLRERMVKRGIQVEKSRAILFEAE